jgi:eukaryotic-like serine/threonine-protein kinase
MSERMLSALSLEPRNDGKHRILAHLGQGGTADVYLAVAQGPSGFNKLVVLKVLKASLQGDPEFAGMFLNEARLAARLNHPNIVQTYEVIEENGVSMMVMEYLEGQPLSAVLHRAGNGELPLSIHLKIIAEMLAGLHYAHELKDFDGTPLGVVHRDATPHNLFVTFDGQIKVLDFGIAKLDVSAVETRAGMLKGKIRYMAPEQILCKPIDRRVDVYAAGVMLWQAATGEALWKNMPEAAIVARVLDGATPSPRSVNPDVHDWLEHICLRALAHEPEERYSTAAELEADIEALLAEIGGPVTAREAGKFVSQRFADVREATKVMIEQQLSTSASMTWTGRRFSGTVPLGSGDGSSPASGRPSMLEGSRPSTVSVSAPTVVAEVKTSFNWRLAVVGAALVALLVVLLFRGNRVENTTAQTNPNSTVQLAAPPAPPPAPVARGALRISALPSASVLFLDDERLPSNPFDGVLPVDGAEHVVRAEAPNHVTASRTFVMKHDLEMVLTLDRAKAEPAAPARRRAASPSALAAPRKSAAPAPAAPGSPNCHNPFFIDQRGIKRVLPECM